MCGIVGLSVGCELVTICTRAAWVREAGAGSGAAPSQLDASWDERASARVAPRRRISSDSAAHLLPRAMIPVLTTAAAGGLDDETRALIEIRHLYRFLNFTVVLESLVVNRTLLKIYQGTSGVMLGAPRRIDALRMYVDEAYHTLAAADMAAQVEELTGVPDLERGSADLVFGRRLEEIKREASSPNLGALLDLVFVIVSETLISGTLGLASADSSINQGVRDVIRDHARDEGRHHAFFATYLQELWAVLTPRERGEVGRAAPRLIHAFFAPELASVKTELTSYGLSAGLRADLVDTAYSADRVGTSVRVGSARTVRYFEEIGAMEYPGVLAAFQEHGLMEERGSAPRTPS